MAIEQLHYTVERWTSDHRIREEILVRTGDIDMARASMLIAMKKYPTYLIMLCQKARIIERSDRHEEWMT